nr:helix-turn-helix transcriptional regulator [uncultured Sphaerochaeta sp.]
MKHLILLSYIIIFSTGFGALAVLLMLSVRLKQPFTKCMAVVQGLFIASLAVVAIYYYLMQVLELIGPRQTTVEAVFGVISSLLTMGLYLGLWWILGIRELQKGSGNLFLYARISCFVSAVLMVIGMAGSLLSTSTLTTSSIWQAFVYIVVAITLSLFALTLVKATMKQQHSAYRFLVHGIGYSSLAYVPLSLLELLLSRSLGETLRPLSLEYLFYLGINVVVLISSLRSLGKDPTSTSAFGPIQESTWTRFSLTPREREMATLIAQGQSNKEIARNLGISEATVRTHIYNLFQKVGAQSRIDLLNMLHD